MNQPKNLEEVIQEWKKQLSAIPKFVPVLIIVFLLAALSTTCIYSIGPDEVGVVQRFGRYIKTTGSGLHVKLPFGVDKVTPVKTQRIYKEKFGERNNNSGRRRSYVSTRAEDSALMLTGDLNVLDVKWVVQFRINDPVKYLFDTRKPFKNLRDISEVVMRRYVGNYTVDEVLTTKREELSILVEHRMQELLRKYNTGLRVVTVKLLDVNPPDKVKPAFNEVNEAKQEKEQTINKAWEAYNKVIPRAKGEAKRTISFAEGYALDKINRAKGNTQRFLSVLKEYNKAPKITKKRFYLDTMAEVLPEVKQKYIIDKNARTVLPLLNLNRDNKLLQTGGNK
ncbi:MAG: FtsH protease activity modulator HflK [Victivallales bacterium]|nr:FtsH protease activity modulator HflK [Victivallales bacterium]